MPLTVTETSTSGNNGTNGAFTGWEWQFVVDATPVGLQTKPWLDLLYFANRWGYGSSGSGVPAALTNGMHLSTRSEYQRLYYTGWNTVYTLNPSGPTIKLKLKEFLNDLISTASLGLNCTDFAAILRQSMAANGVTANCVEYASEGQTSFVTNFLCNAGVNRTVDDNYSERDPFYYHVVVSVGDNRFDSALSYKHTPNGDTHKNPAAPFGYPDFWQKIVNGTPYGLCKTTPATAAATTRNATAIVNSGGQ